MSTIARHGVIEEVGVRHVGPGDVVVTLDLTTSSPYCVDEVFVVERARMYLDRAAAAPGPGQLDLIDGLPHGMRGLADEGSQGSSAFMSPLDVLKAARRWVDAPRMRENPSMPCPASEIAEVRLTTEDQVRRRDALDARIAADLDRPRRSWWQRFQRPRP